MAIDKVGQDGSSGSEVTQPERRRHLRFPFTASVEATELESGAKISGRTTDLGLGGCYIDTLSPFRQGAQATVRIERGGQTFEAQARVVFSMPGMGMGLAFISAQQKHVRIFQRWLVEISGQPAPQGGSTPEPKPTEKSVAFQNVVLGDLIMTLVSKKVLSETEGKELLKKLFR